MENILMAASEPRTRLITLSHVEYASGQRHDLMRIGQFCAERKILFCVDAIQSLGILPLDVRAMHIDYLSADGHKWLLGPEGAGIFYCRRELIDRTRDLFAQERTIIRCVRMPGDLNAAVTTCRGCLLLELRYKCFNPLACRKSPNA